MVWMKLPTKVVVIVPQWCIVADLESVPQLGETLAREVSGQWQETVLGSQVEYQLRQDGSRAQSLNSLSTAITGYLLHTASNWIRTILLRRYRYFAADEVKSIVYAATQLLFADSAHNQDRINLMKNILAQFLATNDTIVLEGVRRFLIPEISHEFEEGVDRAIDQWLMEKEYREFVRLLRHFVNLNEPKMNIIHVYWQRHQFLLEDTLGQPVGKDILAELASGLPDEEDSPEDLLVSALITIAPRQIVLHLNKPADHLLQTIDGVFEDRVMRCPGCRRCGRGDLTESVTKR